MIKMLFDKDLWQEVVHTLKSQKRRSLLTMFGIFWGVFMLIVLIGCGFGMKKGVIGDIFAIENNSVIYMPQPTSLPYNGLQADRTWNFKDDDVREIEQKLSGSLRYISKANLEGQEQIINGSLSGVYITISCNETYINDIPQEVVLGRYFNASDMAEHKKVCLIGKRVAEEVFPGEQPVGKWTRIGDNMYLVVGVVNQPNQNISLDGIFAHDCIFLPFTTGSDVYGHRGEFGIISVCVGDHYDIRQTIERVDEVLMKRHNIHPDDKAYANKIIMQDAIGMFRSTMSGIEILIFIVGIGTLLAGLIGISNIMLVTIKERTHEIGVRRALGAQPSVIILQIMAEALTLTLVAGIVGIIVGTWTLGALNMMMTSGGSRDSLLVRPMTPPIYAFGSLFILVAGGLVAGYVPAKKALKIKAIEALNYNM